MIAGARTHEQLELEAVELRRALRAARPHVFRQIHAGKHEQDRADAVAWLEEFAELVPGPGGTA